jgi:hypothetical protein
VNVRSSAPSGRLGRWPTVAAACIGMAIFLVLVSWPASAGAATPTSRGLILIPGHGSPGTTQFDVTVTGFVQGNHGHSACAGYLKISLQTPRDKVLESWAEPAPRSSRETYGPFLVSTSSLPSPVQAKASCRSAGRHPSTLSAVEPFAVDTKPVTSPATTPDRGGPSTSSATHALALSSSTVVRHGHVTASGQGCTADVPVLVTINSGAIVGWGQTDRNGSFTVPLKLGSQRVGHYHLDAHCGPQLVSDLSIVASTGAKGGGNSSTPLLIGGIVLLAVVVLVFGFLIRRPGRARHASARADDRRDT